MTSDDAKKSIVALNRKIRRRDLGSALVLIGVLGLVTSSVYFEKHRIVFYISQATIVAGALMGLSVGSPRCPWCGKHFFMRWLGRLQLGPPNILTRKCMNCGRSANGPAM
jgi:hypothetical protein